MRVLVRVRLFGSLAWPICESLGGGVVSPLTVSGGGVVSPPYGFCQCIHSLNGGVVFPLYGFCQCIHSLNACVSVDTLLCNILYQYTCKQLIVR